MGRAAGLGDQDGRWRAMDLSAIREGRLEPQAMKRSIR